MDLYLFRDRDKTAIYVVNRWGYAWQRAITRDPRPVNSVVMDSNMLESLIEDARHFFRSEDWYKERGIPYRRGFFSLSLNDLSRMYDLSFTVI